MYILSVDDLHLSLLPSVVLSPLLFQFRPALVEALTSLSQSSVCSWALGKPWQMQKHLEICSPARFAVTFKSCIFKHLWAKICHSAWCDHGGVAQPDMPPVLVLMVPRKGGTGFLTSVLPWWKLKWGRPYLEESSAEASGRIWLSAADFGLFKAINGREKPVSSWAGGESLQPPLNYRRGRGWNKYKHWCKRYVSLI